MASLEVPLTHPLLYQVQRGNHIQVTGVEPKNSPGFAVNLLAANNDRILNIGVRHTPSEKAVVLNSELNGVWGAEERCSKFPLHHEKPFELLIVATSDRFAVLINGELVGEYQHRALPASIRFVNVDGDVLVTGVYEAAGVRLKKRGFKTGLRTTPVQWVGPSRTAHVKGGLKVGEDILIAAKPCTGDQFVVNLRAGNNIAFHFNPRYVPGVVVRNAFVAGAWGEEETAGDQPFHQGKDFNLQISVKKDRLVAYVNGVKQSTFRHRLSELETIDTIETGGLDLYQIQVV